MLIRNIYKSKFGAQILRLKDIFKRGYHLTVLLTVTIYRRYASFYQTRVYFRPKSCIYLLTQNNIK